MNTIKQLITASAVFAFTITCASVAQAAAKNCPADNGITTKIGPTGFIEILEYGIFASFFEDDQIITVANAPNCVAWVRSSNKPLSPAGDTFGVGPDITASSSFYQNNPIRIEPDSTNFYLFNDSIFDATTPATVQLETQGNVSVPKIPALTLQSPGPGITKMIDPKNISDGNGGYLNLDIDSGVDYPVAWEVLNPAPAKDMAVSLFQIVASSPIGSSKLSHINCVFPYTAGQGTIPANLMTEVRTRTLNGQAASTRVDVIPGIQAFPGEARLINIDGAYYFVDITRSDSVDQLYPNGVQLLQPSVVDCTKKKC